MNPLSSFSSPSKSSAEKETLHKPVLCCLLSAVSDDVRLSHSIDQLWDSKQNLN